MKSNLTIEIIKSVTQPALLTSDLTLIKYKKENFYVDSYLLIGNRKRGYI